MHASIQATMHTVYVLYIHIKLCVTEDPEGLIKLIREAGMKVIA